MTSKNRAKQESMAKGILLMLTSAFFTCCGQLLWKLSAYQYQIPLLLCGFVLYGCGALLMIIALQFGELSVLHPMLSAGYILSLFLGYFVLDERITLTKLAGVAIIICGLILISRSTKEKK